MFFRTLLFYILLNIFTTSGEPVFRNDYIYNQNFSSFYKLHRISSNWIDAKFKCQQEGALLFYPETKDEALYVSNILYTQYGNGWVGISDLLASKQFETVTGISAESVYCNWEVRYPKWNEDMGITYTELKYRINENSQKHCVILNSMGNMETIKCDTNLPFVCKKTYKSIVWNNDCNMADPKYIYNSKFEKCYKLHLRTMDWTTAHSTCIAEQSHLAIIGSQEEANFLINMTTEATKTRHREVNLGDAAVHIGFHDLFHDGYTTVKGYPLIETSYVKWSNQMYERQGEKLCGSMTYGGELINIDCNDNSYFICEQDIEMTEDSTTTKKYFLSNVPRE